MSGRDIGLDVPIPDGECEDQFCPFHGNLPVRGQTIDGIVVSNRMRNTAVVTKEYRRLIPKYERFERRSGRYSAHNPPCIAASPGDRVTIAECRSLTKTVSFVIVARREGQV